MAASAEQRRAALGFTPQSEIKHNRLLPYAEQLDEESNRVLREIKENLGRAVLLREMDPGCRVWSLRIIDYIYLYGFKFSKEDHVAFIKVLYELVIIPNLEPQLVNSFASVLTELLSKSRLISPEELELPWRPLYDLRQRITHESHATDLGMYLYPEDLDERLTLLMVRAKYYFPVTATAEILAEFLPYLAPFQPPWFAHAMESMVLLLPVSHRQDGGTQSFQLWLPEFIDLWRRYGHHALEGMIMRLIARVACVHLGHVDWNPHVPFMFSRFQHALGLPVSYKGLAASPTAVDMTNVSLWIICTWGSWSSTPHYFEKLMQTIETYVQPSNFGGWVTNIEKLLRDLVTYFVLRIKREQGTLKTADPPVPESHRLTEADIDQFVAAILPVMMQAALSESGAYSMMPGLQKLASLRPGIVVPAVVQRMYTNLDLVLEPHKLLASIISMMAVARPMLEQQQQQPSAAYMEGPRHVLPLLTALLPAIDPNDSRKCFFAFVVVWLFSSLVPLVDCSRAAEIFTDLTPVEEAACEASAGFEDFVVQFVDRCLLLVANSARDLQAQQEQPESPEQRAVEAAEDQGLMDRGVLAYTFKCLLAQASHTIFQEALHKLREFVLGHILETSVAGTMLADICQAFAEVNAPATLHALVPPLCVNVMSLLEEEEETTVSEPHPNTALLYGLRLLSELVCCSGLALVAHVDSLRSVLDRALRLTSREAQQSAGRLLANLLHAMVEIRPSEYRSTHYDLEQAMQAGTHLPVRDWARAVPVTEVKVSWSIPGPEEASCVQQLVSHFLPPELNKLETFAAGSRTLTREELQASLNIVVSVMDGLPLLPLWEEPLVTLEESVVKQPVLHLVTGLESTVTLPDGGNVRLGVARVALALQKYLLQDHSHEDDTRSLGIVVTILELTLKPESFCESELERQVKDYHFLKELLSNPVTDVRAGGSKWQLRRLVLERAQLQHRMRLAANVEREQFTATHRDVILALLQLATSRYSEVRSSAQTAVDALFTQFPCSHRLLVAPLLQLLALDPQKNHEQFKGALYVVLGPHAEGSLVARGDWTTLPDIWLAMVRASPSEKPSVVSLLEVIQDTINRRFFTPTIILEVPDSCASSGELLWRQTPLPLSPLPSTTEVTQAREKLAAASQDNRKRYLALVEGLLDLLASSTLHWRHQYMALNMLRDLVHPDVLFSPRTVKFFLDCLNHDMISFRKVALTSTMMVLQQHKRKHVKVAVDPCSHTPGAGLRLLQSFPAKRRRGEVTSMASDPGDHRADTTWLQYQQSARPLTAEQWDMPQYLHRIPLGYHTWPRRLEIYGPSRSQPSLERRREDLSACEREVVDFFTRQKSVDCLVGFLALEEHKGQDAFARDHATMFKMLFRNHGVELLTPLVPHLKRLAVDKNESNQRCAAEIISGCIRGSKHWSFPQVESMWDQLTPVIRAALDAMTIETLRDWSECFILASEQRDPLRNHCLLELLMEEPLRQEAAIKDYGRLYMLESALSAHDWRVAELLHRLLDYLKPHLAHPFENVRARLASVLALIFHLDVPTRSGQRTRSPHLDVFLAEMLPRLEVLYQSGPKVGQSLGRLEEMQNGPETADDSAGDMDTTMDLSAAGDSTLGSLDNSEVDMPADEREVALRLLKTVLTWLTQTATQYRVHAAMFSLLPLACLLESCEGESQDVSAICSGFLAALACTPHPPDMVLAVLSAVDKVLVLGSWRARSACLDFLEVFVFNNMAILLSCKDWVRQVTAVVLRLLKDERPEVRERAAQVLGGLLHCQFLADSAALLADFTKQSRAGRQQGRGRGAVAWSAESLAARHSAVLGLCAFIDAFPYEVPDFVPAIFVLLGSHLNDPPPISTTIRKTLGNFKRTHHDNWQSHMLKFSEEELEVLSGLVVPPDHYA